MARVLVTGSNRGIGLEFTRQLLARGDDVLAACRAPEQAQALHELAHAHPQRLTITAVEMADEASIAALAAAADAHFSGLDLLINNAGMNVRGERMGTVRGQDLQATLRTNAVGTFLLTQALAPLLGKGERPLVANISSQVGSIARTSGFHSPSYAISKAALNMASVLLARGMAAAGVSVAALHPGWVQTAMGGPHAPLPVAESVAHLLRTIAGLTLADSGRFLDHDGTPMPW
ncbi:MAG: SDR family oxidoreductase [Proteobacteria bacterium]|nr:SDR family oxidoreductase [Pseudomonadota bacterium]MBS0464723.1 SDR family oxidoreductase [Pseudomonadota bacterium]